MKQILQAFVAAILTSCSQPSAVVAFDASHDNVPEIASPQDDGKVGRPWRAPHAVFAPASADPRNAEQIARDACTGVPDAVHRVGWLRSERDERGGQHSRSIRGDS